MQKHEHIPLQIVTPKIFGPFLAGTHYPSTRAGKYPSQRAGSDDSTFRTRAGHFRLSLAARHSVVVAS